MKQYICIDIGGTAIKYGIVDENATILLKKTMSTEAWKGGNAVLEKVVKIVHALQSESKDDIKGICISTAGMVDVKKGSIFYASSLIPDYTGIELKRNLEEKFGIPCEVENDVNCAGLAEYYSGAAKGSAIALMLTIGTGIGGSLIAEGKIFRGFHNSACEIGYMYMDGSDFQTLGAASVLSKKVSEKKKESKDLWDGYRIFEEAKKGDDICCEAIDEMCEILGKGIANICYVVNPEVVVLGGGIMEQADFFKEKIQVAVKKYLISSIAQYTTILFAKHQNDAGMIGAFYHFCKQQNI